MESSNNPLGVKTGELGLLLSWEHELGASPGGVKKTGNAKGLHLEGPAKGRVSDSNRLVCHRQHLTRARYPEQLLSLIPLAPHTPRLHGPQEHLILFEHDTSAHCITHSVSESRESATPC